MLPTITLQPFHYRGIECIGLDDSGTNSLEKEIRKIKGIKWCGEKNQWYLPLSKDTYLLIKTFLANKASLVLFPLRAYLEQRKASALLIKKNKVSKARASLLLQYPLSEENLEAFKKFQDMILLKGYSETLLKRIVMSFTVCSAS